MAREKLKTLTEQMFYVLLGFRKKKYGTEVMNEVAEITGGRITIGAGTMYNLTDQFLELGLIMETESEGRKRSYILTYVGRKALETEIERLKLQLSDYEKFMGGEDEQR